MRGSFQWFEEVFKDFHILVISELNALGHQLLLVVIQWTCNKISPILIMRKCFQCFEEAL
jgi:hypothetical protein